MPNKKKLVITSDITSDVSLAGRMTTRTGNRDRVVGLPDMPAKRATKEEVAAKKTAAEHEKAHKFATNLEAVKKVAAIEDALNQAETAKDANANQPISTKLKRVHRRVSSTITADPVLQGNTL